MNDRGHNMKLINIPLRPSTLSLLTRRGFHTTADVYHSKKSGIANLAAELEVDLAEAASIGMEVESALKCILCGEESSIQLSNPMKMNAAPRTAAAILSASIKNANYRPIISFVRSIDSLLGGGFQPHEVTEIAGMPGTGKTQLAMQLCVDAKLPRPFGGVDGDSIYIDSEGSFSPERCHDMAVALVDHLQASSKRSNGQKVVPSNFTVDAILDSIHVFRVYDEASQTATIMGLSDFLERRKNEGKQIKLLVIDSIAFHYRCSTADYKSRTKSLSTIAAQLSELANKFELVVVVINQMTSKSSFGSEPSEMEVNGSDFGSSTKLIPALGESWSHATTTRLLLMKDPNSNGFCDRDRHICKLVKSANKPCGTAFFTVTKSGVRDCVSSP